MRSEIIKQIQSETKEDSRIFAKKYADIVLRINYLLKKKNFSQKDLAEKMQKNQSEISKWLNGEHNFTLRSIAKLEAELDEVIIYIPKSKTIELHNGQKGEITMFINNYYRQEENQINYSELGFTY